MTVFQKIEGYQGEKPLLSSALRSPLKSSLPLKFTAQPYYMKRPLWRGQALEAWVDESAPADGDLGFEVPSGLSSSVSAGEKAEMLPSFPQAVLNHCRQPGGWCFSQA